MSNVRLVVAVLSHPPPSSPPPSQSSALISTTPLSKMAHKDPSPERAAKRATNNKKSVAEIVAEMGRRKRASQKTPETVEKAEEAKKANVAVVAKIPRELLPTQDVVSSLHFYPSDSPKTSKSEPAKDKVDAPAPTQSSRRSKLESEKLALAQKLSQGEITPAEYERAMCLLWDRPKLSADGEWVIIGSDGPSDENENTVDDSNQQNGGRCGLM